MTSYTIVLNIKQENTMDSGIAVSQGDFGQVEFIIRVKDNDSYILDAQSAIIAFLTPNGEIVKGDLTGTQGTYSYIIQGNELLTPGKITARVTLIYTDGRKSSCGFSFTNRYNPLYDRNTPAKSYIPEIEKIKQEGEETVSYLKELVTSGDFKGDQGKSAYEIAIENGFVGTEQEWLESLIGDVGAGLKILGTYENIESLEAAHPSGNPGDAYLIGGDLYIWSNDKTNWINSGKIEGPPGLPGPSEASGITTIDNNGILGDFGSSINLQSIIDEVTRRVLNEVLYKNSKYDDLDSTSTDLWATANSVRKVNEKTDNNTTDIARLNSDLDDRTAVDDLFAIANIGRTTRRIVKCAKDTLNTPYKAGVTSGIDTGTAIISMGSVNYGVIFYLPDGGTSTAPYICKKTNGEWGEWTRITTNADMRDYNCTQTAGTANYTLSILPIIFGRVVVIRLNNVVCKTPATSITLVSNNAPMTNRGVSAVLCDSTGSGDTMRAIYGTEGQISLIGGTAGKTYFGEIVTISQLDI